MREHIDHEKLRIAIAEKMGYRNVRYDWVNGSDAIKDWMHEGGRGIPEYTSDLNAAWQLVEWMSNKGFHIVMDTCDGCATASFLNIRVSGPFNGQSDTPALAICLAFAKANGIEIPTTEGSK